MLDLKKMIRSCLSSVSCLLVSSIVIAQPISQQAGDSAQQEVAQQALSPLENQRALYEQAQTLLDNNDLEAFQVLRPELNDYPLTPYLDYRVFVADIGQRSPKEVDDFKQEYKDVPVVGSVSARYINALAQAHKWDELLAYQKEAPSGQAYQCYWYYANLKQGNKPLAFKGAESLWLTGRSVSSACDNLFSEWDKAGLRTDELVLQRMLLGFQAGNSGLFSYLEGLLTQDSSKQEAKDLQALFDDPNGVKAYSESTEVTPFSQKLSELALTRLIRKNTGQAVDAFDTVMSAQQQPSSVKVELGNLASAWLMNTSDDNLSAWRDKTLSEYGLPHRIERRARLAIQYENWRSLSRWIQKLPQEDQDSLRWQFWLARVEMSQGKNQQAKKRLTNLLGQRNFYSVAAANILGEPIRYESKILTGKLADISGKQDALDRVQEMIAVDKISAAKAEWRWLLKNSTQDEKKALAQYAATKRWHNSAVVASISAKMWDYTSIRFPIAHRWWFDFYSKQNNVPMITLLSLSRQESALDVEANSPVGARGMMQIMPRTAQHTADLYDIEYSGADELFDIQKNIEIGSAYLGGLLKDFDNNRIFAFAAYNAGPHRVKTWRARTKGKIDVYSFIEAIPFDETRGYVQNILMFETYYRNLLGVEGVFLTPEESKGKY